MNHISLNNAHAHQITHPPVTYHKFSSLFQGIRNLEKLSRSQQLSRCDLVDLVVAQIGSTRHIYLRLCITVTLAFFGNCEWNM